jgi:hypothetical protein
MENAEQNEFIKILMQTQKDMDDRVYKKFSQYNQDILNMQIAISKLQSDVSALKAFGKEI